MKTRRTIITVIKAHKFVSGVLGLFLAIIGSWAAIKGLTRKDITGQWKLKFAVEKCNHKEYVGTSHTQITVFSQSDKDIIGKGEKWEYNGEILPFDQHRKIEYTGTIDGDELKAIYVLHGRDRDSEGSISVIISGDGKTLKGTYSGTIGNDSGPVTGERMN